MFYSHQDLNHKQEYIKTLQIIGSLSNLFSESQVPYLYYRIAEKLFCDIFGANDLSRGDIALDASKKEIGIGLKTFLKKNDKTLQKVAEFNKDRFLYDNKNEYEIVQIIAELRNKRIDFAQSISSVEQSYYHCILRDKGMFYIFEESMDFIQLDKIKNIKKKKNTIVFNDDLHEYSFNLSKSTLFKRFNTSSILDGFEVKILENPLYELKQCFQDKDILSTLKNTVEATMYLPLYSKGKKVSEKSGLNQWNAAGRVRDPNEIYIPIPKIVHQVVPNFFPPRDTHFNLHLPNNKILTSKVCQDNSKALMSNPNKALGKWLLRDVLHLKEGELLTYDMLRLIGIDSVRIDKIDNENYKINFVAIGSYEEFLESQNLVEY